MNADLSIIDLLDFKAGTVQLTDDISSLPALKQHYVQQGRRFGDEGIDAIYFSGEYPSVYFKQVEGFAPETIQEVVRIQRKVWNQGKVPFLYVQSPVEVRIYNCFNTPNYEKQENPEEGLLLYQGWQVGDRARKDLETLRDVFGKVAIESGVFWQNKEYAQQVDVKKRVDRVLINNIKQTRRLLRKQSLAGNDSIIHDLLLRSLFILYLEDRGATDTAFYDTYLPGATSYFDVLKDLQATYRLYETLEIAFNGNLSPVQPAEQMLVTTEHLDTIKRCFWSDWALTNQQALPGFDWRIFDFEFIPIQIISEIYEDFLSEEVGDEQIAKTGTFYTPHALAEFILNQVLPYPTASDVSYDVPTLDPTCGSGIFLVDTLNRLLDRWEYAHPGQKLTFDIIKEIVLNNIFGVEIEPEAIKVAAFSIYLAMLDRLDPKTLWQNNRFPYLIYDEDRPDQQEGRNLFRMSSLKDGPFAERTYALVVGNPPFTNKVSPEVMAYLTKLKFGKETVIAFLHRVTDLCPTGKIALITTSKILFNNGSGYRNFRDFLFNKTFVERVYNFSALRRVSQQLGGRNLFASATRPVSVLLYSKQYPTDASERIIYYTPTTAFKNRLIDGIAIDPTDVKYLPRTECQKPDTKIWKATMWGTDRDFNLVKRLVPEGTISQYLKKKEYSEGVGFQTSSINVSNESISRLPHISAKSLERYYTSSKRATAITTTEFRRLGAVKTYESPHLLIKEGQANKRFCASYLDYDCSFRHTIYGISSKQNAENLKLLTAYLNSSFSTYIMFLTAADWGIERERILPNEVLSLPALCFSIPNEAQQQVVAKVDEIIALRKQDEALSVEDQILNIEDQIEAVFRNGLNLSDIDKVLIDDFLTYRLGAFQERQDSVAFRPVEAEHSRQYATYLCETINRFLQPGDSLQARAKYFNVSRKTPLQVIVLHLDEQRSKNPVEQLDNVDINKVLRDLESYTYEEEAESIYFRRFIRYYNNDSIYIVKPNEQRFWSRSMALNDADEIILEILTSEAE